MAAGIQSHQTAQFTGVQAPFASGVDRCPAAVSGAESNIRSGPNSGGWSVLDGLGEVIGNLKEMDRTPCVCNSLLRAYQIAGNILLDKEDREQIQTEIDELKDELGLTNG